MADNRKSIVELAKDPEWVQRMRTAARVLDMDVLDYTVKQIDWEQYTLGVGIGFANEIAEFVDRMRGRE